MKRMIARKENWRTGVTLIELMTAMLIALIPLAVAGGLLLRCNQSWGEMFDVMNSSINTDAAVVMAKFATIGRCSNRQDYKIYRRNGSTFTQALPNPAVTSEVIGADAVEFHYWDVYLDAADSHNLLDAQKTGTAYAFFYLDDNKLKVDYGPYPPGAILAGGTKNIPLKTEVLANNVSANSEIGIFEHTAINGKGQGCVRINIKLTDPNNGDSVIVTTAALMRNFWPR